MSSAERLRHEGHGRRIEGITLDSRPADGGESPHHGQVLRLEPGPRPPLPDAGKAERAAQRHREGQGRTQDLPAALAVRGVDRQQTGCSPRISSSRNCGMRATSASTTSRIIPSTSAIPMPGGRTICTPVQGVSTGSPMRAERWT